MPTLVVGMQFETEEHAHDERGHGTHNFACREGRSQLLDPRLAADSVRVLEPTLRLPCQAATGLTTKLAHPRGISGAADR